MYVHVYGWAAYIPLEGKVRDASVGEIEVAEVGAQTQHSEHLHNNNSTLLDSCAVTPNVLC